jgi:hypothetical protein
MRIDPGGRFQRMGGERRRTLRTSDGRERGPERRTVTAEMAMTVRVNDLIGGRYWVRTSDLSGVNGALFH